MANASRDENRIAVLLGVDDTTGDPKEVQLDSNNRIKISAVISGLAFTDLSDTPSSYNSQGGKIVSVKSDESGLEFTSAGGTGDVNGPASSTDNAIARFDGTGGKTLQNSGITIDDSDNVSGVGTLNSLTLPSSNFVGLTDSQTLTNKTIDADNNTISNLAHGAEVDNPSSGVHGVTGNVVGTTDTQTLTNKTVSGGTLSGTTTYTNAGAGSDPTLASNNAAQVLTLTGTFEADGVDIVNAGAGSNPALSSNSASQQLDLTGDMDISGALTLGTDLAISEGGTGASTASSARSNLGLAIGSDVQAHGAVLDDLNTLGAATADGQFIVATGAGAFAYESGATARTSLGLAIGSDVQAWDDDLDDIAALTHTKGNVMVSDGTDWVNLGVGSDNQVLTADSAEATGVKWADSGGGGGGTWEVVDSGTLSSNQTTVFNKTSISTDYDVFRLRYYLQATGTNSGNISLYMQFNGDTGTNYNYNYTEVSGGSVSGSGLADQNQIDLLDGRTLGSDFIVRGSVEIFKPVSGSAAAISARGGSNTAAVGGNGVFHATDAWWDNTSSKITSIKLYSSDGTEGFDTGFWVLEGAKIT